MSSAFNAEKTKNDIIEWARKYFEDTASPETPAIVGISGGKDSSVTAKLLTEALGRDRVIGVLMPCGEQADIDVSRRVVGLLGIKSYEINVGSARDALVESISKNISLTSGAVINTPPRIRMAALYAIAACTGGRVANTCNLSEDYVGYSTKFGDSAGDFSLLSELTVTEVIAVGDALGLPYDITHKVPIDGLCGKTDEENLGFSYAELDRYIREGAQTVSSALAEKIEKMHRANLHKLLPMPKFEYGIL